MPDPPACQSITDQIQARTDGIKGLQAQLHVVPAQGKSALISIIKKWDAEIVALKQQYAVCMSAFAPPTTPTLSVSKVSVVQSLESGSSIPVHEGPAVVRVFVDSGIRNFFDAGAGPNRWPGVSGSLWMRIPGYPPIITAPFNGPINAVPRFERKDEPEDASLNFLVSLPANLPDVVLQAEVFVVASPRTDNWQATASIPVPITAKIPQPVAFVPITRPKAADVTGPTRDEMLGLHLAATTRFPFLSFQVRIHPPLPWNEPLTSESDAVKLMGALRAYGLWVARSSLVVGWIRPTLTPDLCGLGGAKNIFRGPAAILCGTDQNLCLETYAHELGHAFGVMHARCKGTEPNIDVHLPSTVSTTGWEIPPSGPTRIVRRSQPELMSYCTHAVRWPSVSTYERVMQGAPT